MSRGGDRRRVDDPAMLDLDAPIADAAGMMQRLFLDHPRAVGESYGQHFRVASRVGALMIAGGLAAFVHALVPEWHKKTGSRMIRRLNAELQGRVATEAELAGAITYEI